MNAFRTELKMMFSLGRLNRLRFLAYSALTSASFIPVLFFAVAVLPASTPAMLGGFLVGLFLISQIIVQLWLLSRRMNDTGLSSKWIWRVLIISFFVVLCAVIVNKFLHIDLAKFMALPLGIGIFIYAAVTLIMYFIKGTPSDNRYGPPPSKNNFLTIIFFI